MKSVFLLCVLTYKYSYFVHINCVINHLIKLLINSELHKMKLSEYNSINGFNQLLIQQIPKGLNYIYRGPFTENVSESILSLFESNLENQENIRNIRRKVYQVMVEGLQNATEHQAEKDKFYVGGDGIFILRKEKQSYYIITGNLVTNEEKENLIDKIRQINFLGEGKLNAYHKKILLESINSESGGSSLGLLEMARKSGNKFLYSFKKMDQELSYFYLLTEIPARKQNTLIEESENVNHFDYLPLIHDYLNKENVIILFNSLLNQDSLVNLISFVEREIDETFLLKRRLYSLMIEIIQNMIVHASQNPELESEQSSIFYLSQTEKEYLLNSGNYIKNDQAETLTNKIDLINFLDDKGLKQFYEDKLFNFENDYEKVSGLGFCDIRMKSGHKIEYKILPVSQDYSFFSLRVRINKSH